MRDLWFPILLLAVVLAVPILPFVGFGATFEAYIQSCLARSLSPSVVAAMTVGLLASDIFLPVPSSVVSTAAAAACGFWLAAAASWLGMTLSGILGFWLARHWGRWMAVRLSRPEEVRRIDRLSRRYGPMLIVLARPIPVLAEASVLALGTSDLPWRTFLTPLVLSNLGIAVVYAALGHLVRWPIALAAAVAIPLVAFLIARHLWPRDA